MNNSNIKLINRIQDGFSLDLRSLSLYRVLISIYLLVDLATRSLYLKKHYTDYGIFPRSSSIQEDRFSFHQLSGSTAYVSILFIVNAIILFSLLIGYRTRLSTILAFLFLGSLQNRNHFLTDGSDDYCRMFVFWSIFLPLGRVFSIDSVLSASSNNKISSQQQQQQQQQPVSMKYLSGGSVSFILQFNYIYIFTAIFKAGSAWHGSYDAVYLALHLVQFKHGLADFLLQFPAFLTFLTKATLIFEYIGPLLLVSPWFNTTARLVSILGFIAMHIGFGVCLNLYLFVFIPMVVCSAFIPSKAWDYIQDNFIMTKNPIKIYYNSNKSKSDQIKSFINYFSTFFLINQNIIINNSNNNNNNNMYIINNSTKNNYSELDIEIGNGSNDNISSSSIPYVENITVQFNGDTYTEEKAIQFLVSKSTILYAFSNLSDKYYEKILSYILNININNNQQHHDKFSKTNNQDIFNNSNINHSYNNNNNNNSSSNSSLKRNLKNLFFIVTLSYLFYYNMCIYTRMVPDYQGVPIKYLELSRFLKIDQYWAMFAPEPPRHSVWLVSEARFKSRNITNFDILTGETVNFKSIPSLYFNSGQRERNFFLSLSYVDYLRLEFGRYYCRKYNIYEKDPSLGKLTDFKIYSLTQLTPPLGIDLESLEPHIKFQYTNSKLSLIWEHTC